MWMYLKHTRQTYRRLGAHGILTVLNIHVGFGTHPCSLLPGWRLVGDGAKCAGSSVGVCPFCGGSSFFWKVCFVKRYAAVVVVREKPVRNPTWTYKTVKFLARMFQVQIRYPSLPQRLCGHSAGRKNNHTCPAPKINGSLFAGSWRDRLMKNPRYECSLDLGRTDWWKIPDTYVCMFAGSWQKRLMKNSRYVLNTALATKAFDHCSTDHGVLSIYETTRTYLSPHTTQ